MTAKRKAVKPKPTKLETQLANALVRVWEAMPFDLSDMVIEARFDDEDERDEFVSRLHSSSIRALNAALRRGWKRPKS